ncbi:MAG: TetR family transcriptional regulator [Micrococcales bacterium]|nr:MAG: TetR family transcriptional regulator [Micrococcales bacterium]PIE26952.1 MAG: TetR family transcriptional regulator [Micrococcales bacterium]
MAVTSSQAGRTGRRRGSPDTRQQILDAARTLFAQRGFSATSVRAVARKAAVDPALIHHYFGSKDGLFLAIVELPFNPSDILSRVEADRPELAEEQVPVRLVDAFLTIWEGPVTGPAMVGLLRRVVADAEHFSVLRDFYITHVLKTGAPRLMPAVHPDEARLRMALTFSQLLGVVAGRHVLRLEPLAGLDRTQLRAVLIPVVKHHLYEPLPTEGHHDA